MKQEHPDHCYQTLSHRSERRADEGFSLVEMMIALGIGMILILGVLSFQVFTQKENRAISQKLESIEFQRQLGQIMADDNVCTCQVSPPPSGPGLTLTPMPGATPVAGAVPQMSPDLPSLTSTPSCLPGGGAPKVFVSAGAELPGSRYQLPVSSIRFANLLPSGKPPVVGGPLAGAIEYLGDLEVIFGPLNNTDTRLVRPIQPARVSKKFYALGGKLVACGSAPASVVYEYGADVMNSPTDSTKSTATCPPGMIAIGGGWEDTGKPPHPACPTSAGAVVLSSAPENNNTSWSVIALCHEFRAVVTCYRP